MSTAAWVIGIAAGLCTIAYTGAMFFSWLVKRLNVVQSAHITATVEAAVKSQLEPIKAELTYNGGNSLKDLVGRMDDRLSVVEQVVMRNDLTPDE
jgi:hypothetical protein